MPTPYPLIDEPGIVTEVQREFVRSLQRPLSSYAIFAGKETKVAHWGIETLKWREVSDLSGVTISMDVPPVQGDSGTIKARTVELPIFSKDATFAGRKWRQYQEMGLDPVVIQAMGKAMAEEINKVLLKGRTGGPGPATSILNHADINTLGSPGNWNTGGSEAINKDLAGAMKELRLDQHYGPYTLLLHPDDSDLLDQFVGDQPIRFSQVLNQGINRLLYDSDADSGVAYVIDSTPGNYDVVSPRDGPFGLGSAIAGVLNAQQFQEDNELFVTRTIRFMNILAPRVIRGTAVCKIDFTR